MEISAQWQEYDIDNQWVNHEITINGRRYIIFDKFKGYGWGEAAQRFADMINNQLELQGSDERFYLINGGNDGRAVFLTEKQFMLLDSLIASSYEKPLKMEQWCDVMSVRRAPI